MIHEPNESQKQGSNKQINVGGTTASFLTPEGNIKENDPFY